MQRLWVFVGVVLICVATSSSGTRADSLTPYRPPLAPEKREFPSAEKAWRLFELARQENGGLRWDECLAVKAMRRARNLVEQHLFDHRDPWTGENEAWRLVESCLRCRYAGENLTRGYQSAEETHDALMKSPEHRRNILDPKFQFLGVGCHDYICVELFAGSHLKY